MGLPLVRFRSRKLAHAILVRLNDQALQSLLRFSLGDPAEQREASALALHRELARGEADVLAAAVAWLGKECRRREQPFIASVTIRSRSVVGPLSTPPQRGCIECVQLRLTESARSDDSDAPTPSLSTGSRDHQPEESVSRLVEARIIKELVDYIAGVPDDRQSLSFLLVDASTRFAATHSVIPHEHCPVCGASAETENPALLAIAALVEVASRDVPLHTPQEDLLDHVKPLVDEHSGLVRRLGEGSFIQVPLVRSEAVVAWPTRSGLQLMRTVSSALTYRAARLAAVQGSLSHGLAASFSEQQPPVRATVADLLGQGFPLALHDDRDAREHDWTWAFELPALHLVLVPKSRRAGNDQQSWCGDTPICVGTMFQALLEDLLRAAARMLVAHDVVTHGSPVMRLLMDGRDVAPNPRLLTALRRYEIEPRLYAINHPLGIPAVVVLSESQTFQVAAGASFADAAHQAIRLLLQHAQSRAHGEIPDSMSRWLPLPRQPLENTQFALAREPWTVHRVLRAMTALNLTTVCVPFGTLQLGETRLHAGTIHLDPARPASAVRRPS